MPFSLELLVARDGDQIQLRSPEVGTFTRALPGGALVWPGAPAGFLHSLRRAFELVVPAGVTGRVLDPVPALVHLPVGYGTVLYRLAALEAGGLTTPDATESAGTDTLAVRAPYSGRVWLRPAPGEEPFVRVGQELTEGTPLGLLEVMKTFTHLSYQVKDGLPERARVLEVRVSDGAEVKDRDALIVVEPAQDRHRG